MENSAIKELLDKYQRKNGAPLTKSMNKNVFPFMGEKAILKGIVSCNMGKKIKWVLYYVLPLKDLVFATRIYVEVEFEF